MEIEHQFLCNVTAIESMELNGIVLSKIVLEFVCSPYYDQISLDNFYDKLWYVSSEFVKIFPSYFHIANESRRMVCILIFTFLFKIFSLIPIWSPRGKQKHKDIMRIKRFLYSISTFLSMDHEGLNNFVEFQFWSFVLNPNVTIRCDWVC